MLISDWSSDVCSSDLPSPLAPELAARDAGIEVALAPMLAAHARLAAQSDVVVVEGVGGWAAPLSADLDQADLVRALDIPVVLVVGDRKSVVWGKSVSVRVDLGGRRIIKKTKTNKLTHSSQIATPNKTPKIPTDQS